VRMRPEQTVSEMTQKVLNHQAKALVGPSGQPFQAAMEGVANTEAGRQLRDLAAGEHRLEKAQDWQVCLFAERAEGRLMHLGFAPENTLSRFAAERHYSWVENYLEWLEGNEARAEYHALLEEELASLRG
jgi:hypothetical protein